MNQDQEYEECVRQDLEKLEAKKRMQAEAREKQVKDARIRRYNTTDLQTAPTTVRRSERSLPMLFF
jgi:predicted DNA binding CopG/RHH family protein